VAGRSSDQRPATSDGRVGGRLANLTLLLTIAMITRPCWAEVDMAGKGHRIQVKLKSTESSHIYYAKKNKQNTPDRLELKKYDPVVRKHVVYKESR
jgi:large subunit ribosomal protein L33